ncbi:hypothetical protein TEA_013519 [Camellia sinensis var. sinensis]|uniref:PhoD-like phosphatase metallophosphatase domain-containing protein n=1 Tax=Camellia sinensis var. sinensis TaxID=542762 RepID=A0A4S4D0W1_CAMSN|nr:hypothetical protein TEA_013519 [Camellia sinensis var. sinensis]
MFQDSFLPLSMKCRPDMIRLRAMMDTVVIGTWDDHDYGLNDAGKEFDRKITNQRLMLDFLDEPQDSPRRKQAGVYASYTFGPAGRQVKVTLLDTRYHRDPLFSDGNILGNSQWTWLEKELNGPASAITIIGSSIQSLTQSGFLIFKTPQSFSSDCPTSLECRMNNAKICKEARQLNGFGFEWTSRIKRGIGFCYIKSLCNNWPFVLYGVMGTFPKGEDFKLIDDSKWAYPSCQESSPATVTFPSEVPGVVDTKYLESYGQKL